VTMCQSQSTIRRMTTAGRS